MVVRVGRGRGNEEMEKIYIPMLPAPKWTAFLVGVVLFAVMMTGTGSWEKMMEIGRYEVKGFVNCRSVIDVAS